MSSPCARILHRASEVLAEAIGEHADLAPRLGPVSGVLKLLAAEVDGGAAAQLEQVSDMQALLRHAQALLPPPGWPHLDALIRFVPAAPADFRFEVLDDQLARLRQALIEVHAWLETAADGPARADLLREIWVFLDHRAAQASRLVLPLW